LSFTIADDDRVEQMPLSCYDWNNPGDVERYVAERLSILRDYVLRPVSGLDDDYIPTIQVLIGVGAIGASYSDAEVRFEGGTSYCDPVIRDYERDMGRIGFSEDNRWVRAQLNVLRELIRQWDGTYAILPFTHFDPFDLANQFRGNDILTDFYERPEEVHGLLGKCADLIIGMERHFRDNMEGYDLEGSVVGCWMPGGTYLSCDLADMVSRQVFTEFNRPYLQRVVDELGGGYLHHHELGVHQIESFAAIEGLSVQFLNRDFNTVHMPYVIDEKIIESSLKLPICFICTYEELLEKIDLFRQGRFIISVRVQDREQGRKALEIIRQYSV
ncbi:MAG: uroporphyrinogen decarboxylase family protein, partial [bacterium]|nr:uroporphyrinogen decarboxylase family protein [bacterium]